MQSLLKRSNYNAGIRPSEHKIGEKSFLTNNGGSIAHNFFEIEGLDPKHEVRLPNVFSMANTASMDFFTKECRSKNLIPHPARMPIGLASFFIDFLTTRGDLVLDPFAGSNTTGFAAALVNRRWVSIEIQNSYIEQSRIRFKDPRLRNKQ
jgi:site-specific DNA-methyltransferase (cytosine-N4-specific)